MKRKFKLLIKHKARLIIFLILSILTIATTILVPKYQWANANILEKGIVCIRGNSMAPTIPDNTIMYVDDVSFQRGAVVAIRNHATLKYSSEDQKILLKRIVGLPGETIEITKKGVLIDGKLLDEPYCDTVDKTLQDTNDIQEIVLSDGEYFLLGDNREESFDSRHVGAVNQSDFLYQLTFEKNDYTAKVEQRNKITSIAILCISIITPIIYFFLCTISGSSKSKDTIKQNVKQKSNKQSKRKA